MKKLTMFFAALFVVSFLVSCAPPSIDDYTTEDVGTVVSAEGIPGSWDNMSKTEVTTTDGYIIYIEGTHSIKLGDAYEIVYITALFPGDNYSCLHKKDTPITGNCFIIYE